MQIKRIDHLVITTADLNACLHFYRDILGMQVRCSNGRYALYFGSEKFNIHTRPAEFLPAAAHPVSGSLDLCLVMDDDIENAKKEIEEKGWPIKEGPVMRNGALGRMQSIYLRDPDGNLIELCHYEKELK